MTPDDLGRLHALCFTVPRPWTPAEFSELLSRQGTFLLTEGEAFLVGRVIADEAELLTLAVPVADRRRGVGQRLVQAFADEALTRGARTAFLEVAASNAAALALYRATGWREAGRRRGYYAGPGGTTDALILARELSH